MSAELVIHVSGSGRNAGHSPVFRMFGYNPCNAMMQFVFVRILPYCRSHIIVQLVFVSTVLYSHEYSLSALRSPSGSWHVCARWRAGRADLTVLYARVCFLMAGSY
eukprot:scpid106666/ scgid25037/ 